LRNLPGLKDPAGLWHSSDLLHVGIAALQKSSSDNFTLTSDKFP